MKKAFFTFGLAIALLVAGFAVYPMNHVASADEIAKGTTGVEVPEDVNYVSDIKTMPNGDLVLFGGNQFDKTLTKYVSTDEGESWEMEDEYLHKLPLDMSGAEAVEAHGYLSDDGYVAISVTSYKKHFWVMTPETDAQAGAKAYAYVINPEGKVIEVEQPYGGYFEAYFAGPKLYFSDVRGNLYEVNRDTGAFIGKVMENGMLHEASVAADSDVLQVIYDTVLGHPFEDPFPGESAIQDELLVYSCAAEAREGGSYIADFEGIHMYSKDAAKQTIWENTRDDFNKYSDFYDMTALDDDTFFVVMFNEKVGDEQLIKIELDQ